MCELRRASGEPPLPLEVVGFRDGLLLSVPLGDTAGIRPGDRDRRARRRASRAGRRRRCSAASSTGSAGRSTASGRSHDRRSAPLHPPPLNPLAREPIVAPIGTGVRAIDALLTCGRGQRIGLFGGSGVGKSTLLGMMARGTAADVVVLGAGRRARPRGAQLPRARPRPGGLDALGRRRLDLRQPAARAAARRLCRDGDRRVLPRPGQERPADDGLGDALRDGAARGRPRGRRAADGQGLSAVGVRAAAGPARARRQRARPGQHHGDLHRARRGRRHTTSRSPTPCARSSTATSCCRATSAPRNHYPAIDVLHERQPDDARRDRRRSTGARPARCATGWRRCATARISSASAPTSPAATRASTRRCAQRDAIDAFLCQPADTSCRLDDAVASLEAL